MDGNEREKLLDHGDAAQKRRRVGARLNTGAARKRRRGWSGGLGSNTDAARMRRRGWSGNTVTKSAEVVLNACSILPP